MREKVAVINKKEFFNAPNYTHPLWAKNEWGAIII